MALNWKTYGMLPRLRSYAQAAKDYENTAPIRGCEHKLRPAGRRDQKWFNIQRNEDTGVITLGYGQNHTDDYSTLLTYYPDGRMLMRGCMTATCRERAGAITGINMQRMHNMNWAWATAYVGGEPVTNHFPMHSLGTATKMREHRPTFILRPDATPIYTNPVPSIRHTIDKAGMKALREEYGAFITYMRSMGKLGDGMLPRMSWGETHDMLTEVPNYPNLKPDGTQGGIHLRARWLTPSQATDNPYSKKRALLFDLAKGDDTEKFYVAMMWLTSSVGYNWGTESTTDAKNTIDQFEQLLIQHHADQALHREEIWTGGIVRDRYAHLLSYY